MRLSAMILFGVVYMGGAALLALWRVILLRAVGLQEFERLQPALEPWFPYALVLYGLLGGVLLLVIVRAELRRSEH